MTFLEESLWESEPEMFTYALALIDFVINRFTPTSTTADRNRSCFHAEHVSVNEKQYVLSYYKWIQLHHARAIGWTSSKQKKDMMRSRPSHSKIVIKTPGCNKCALQYHITSHIHISLTFDLSTTMSSITTHTLTHRISVIKDNLFVDNLLLTTCNKCVLSPLYNELNINIQYVWLCTVQSSAGHCTSQINVFVQLIYMTSVPIHAVLCVDECVCAKRFLGCAIKWWRCV